MQYVDVRSALARYAGLWPDEAMVAEAFLALLSDPQDPFVRDRLSGHFTGSAWVVSADGRRTLLGLTPMAEDILTRMSASHLEELRRSGPHLTGLLKKISET